MSPGSAVIYKLVQKEKTAHKRDTFMQLNKAACIIRQRHLNFCTLFDKTKVFFPDSLTQLREQFLT